MHKKNNFLYVIIVSLLFFLTLDNATDSEIENRRLNENTKSADIYDLIEKVFDQKDLNILKDLVKICGVDCDDKNGISILHLAIFSGNHDMTKYLISEGVDINRKDKYFQSPPIYHAVSRNNIILTQLLKAGANPNTASKGGITALMIASYENFADNVSILIKYGANVNQTDIEGRSAIFYAAEAGHYEIIKILVSVGADINIINKRKENILVLMLMMGHNELIDSFCKDNVNNINQQLTTLIIHDLTNLKQDIPLNKLKELQTSVSHCLKKIKE
ncbi:MAG: ankyrin repeat domain-containing protein [Oceanospirillaceae bacterium]